MRYTTIVDISEFPTIYKNVAARLIYLHLVLKSGYHDHDRDLCQISFRRLAAELNLTISSVRHAVGQLETAHLIVRNGSLWAVKKFVQEQPITARAKTAKQQQKIEADAIYRAEKEKQAREMEIEKARRENLLNQGKTQFMIYYESLMQRADAGDIEAAQLVKKHSAMYRQHQEKMQSHK